MRPAIAMAWWCGHSELGHAIIAYVVCYPGLMLSKVLIDEACKKNLEKSKLPHQIILVSVLAKSSNGKIDKKILYESAMGQLKEKVNAMY